MTDDQPRKVAIVDDDDAVRNSFRFLLEATGHAVETFASAADFLKSEIRHLACLISDNRMEPISGLDLIERLRADGVDIPVLLVTASPSPNLVARDTELGVERVLGKPASVRDLLDFVNAKLS